jgi:5'(3')-deoxyribonucleotidase
MDGVMFDFDGAIHSKITPDPPEMYTPGFYRNLPPMPGAVYFINAILMLPHIDLYVASKHTTGLLSSPSEKLEAIAVHFPKLLKKCIFVCDKGLLRGDMLIDDNPQLWAHKFQGHFFTFDKTDPAKAWSKVYDQLRLVNDILASGAPVSKHRYKYLLTNE